MRVTISSGMNLDVNRTFAVFYSMRKLLIIAGDVLAKLSAKGMPFYCELVISIDESDGVKNCPFLIQAVCCFS